MNLDLIYPNLMAIAELNPTGWGTDIRDNKLHKTSPQQVRNVILRQRSAPRGGCEPVIPPQFV
jgi:hypothetical protein